MSEKIIHESEEKRSRRGISTFFRRIAQRLGRGEKIPANAEQTVAVDAPDEAELEVDIEREDGELSLEIEMEWPEEEEAVVDTDASESKATFHVYEDNAGESRWRLRHDNGNIIADSGEGYASKQKAEQGLESVKRNAPGAHVVDKSRDERVEDPDAGSNATFEIFQDSADKWRWRLRHDNGNIIADGGQGYASKQKAKQGMQSVTTNARGAPVEEEE
jgi:amphi-Trp domain-containing protein